MNVQSVLVNQRQHENQVSIFIRHFILLIDELEVVLSHMENDLNVLEGQQRLWDSVDV